MEAVPGDARIVRTDCMLYLALGQRVMWREEYELREEYLK